MLGSFTFNLASVPGLVGDGVEDLVDRGAETWLVKTPLTEQKGKHGEHENDSFD